MNGLGMWLIDPENVRYGSWADDELCGYGFAYSNNGEIYAGELQNGQRHGEGIQLWKNSFRYCGDWVEGLREGTGTLTVGGASGSGGPMQAPPSPGCPAHHG